MSVRTLLVTDSGNHAAMRCIARPVGNSDSQSTGIRYLMLDCTK